MARSRRKPEIEYLMALGFFGGGGGAAAPFSPLDIPGLALWLDASDSATLFQDSAGTTPATADNDVVGYWADKSGSGNHATQPTTANKPALKKAVQNGLDVLSFDGGDVLWRAALGVTLSTSSIFVVFKQAVAPSNGRMVQGANADNGHMVYLNSSKTSAYAGASLLGPAQSAAAQIVAARFAGDASSNLRVNAGTTYTGNAGSASMNSLGIGANVASGTPANFYTGNLYEIIIVNGVVSDAIRNQTETYLNAKWGVY